MFTIRVIADESLGGDRLRALQAAVEAHPRFHRGAPDERDCAVLLVVQELDGDTAERLRPVVTHSPVPVLVGCCSLSSDVALSTLASGISDVLSSRDGDWETLLAEVAARGTRMHDIESIVASPLVRRHLTGSSPAWLATLRELIAAACFSQAPVLLLGETGTGKDLLARLVHTLDRRVQKRELWVVDCTTLTPELASSELFGHERGAFTGSVGARRGAIAEAHEGTLFLDEVGELPLEVQARLLRTLQEGTYKSVGGDQWKRADFRLICATHRDLSEAVATGRFRADLYFRIAAHVLHVPALRQRTGDIRTLADAFLQEFGCDRGADATVLDLLERHSFPGNVRELRQLMQSAARAHCSTGAVSLGCLPRAWREQVLALNATQTRSMNPVGGGDNEPIAAPIRVSRDTDTPTHEDVNVDVESVVRAWLDQGLGLQEITQRAGDLAIASALALEGNHVGRAARRLGVTERAIQLRKTRRAAARAATEGDAA